MILWILAATICVAFGDSIISSPPEPEDVKNCITGYKVDGTYKKCYKFSGKHNTWIEARFDCQQDKTQLAIPETLDEAIFLGNMLRYNLQLSEDSSKDSNFAFIYFYNLRSSTADDFWRNELGIPLEESLVWAVQEPNNNKTSESIPASCLAIDTMGKLRDTACSIPHVYFCEHELENPFLYRISEVSDNIKKKLKQESL